MQHRPLIDRPTVLIALGLYLAAILTTLLTINIKTADPLRYVPPPAPGVTR